MEWEGGGAWLLYLMGRARLATGLFILVDLNIRRHEEEAKYIIKQGKTV